MITILRNRRAVALIAQDLLPSGCWFSVRRAMADHQPDRRGSASLAAMHHGNAARCCQRLGFALRPSLIA